MKPRLYLLPIEPLAERYTGAWYRWLPESFKTAFDVTVVAGTPLTDKVETGAFLDLNSTLHYKATQLAAIAKLFKTKQVRSGDSFFVADLEFWGIESIRYLSRLQGIHVHLFGFMHAGSYTHGDFMEPMEAVGQFSEMAWWLSCDLVFVGTCYHKTAILTRRTQRFHQHTTLSERIVVTGNPWRTAEAVQLSHRSKMSLGKERDIDVLFPHRPDKEKNPRRFINLIRTYREFGKRIEVAFTTGRAEYRSTNDPAAAKEILDGEKRGEWKVFKGLSQGDFYALLRRSKVVVSTAIEENFGYAMLEAMTMGAYPLMPLAFSYPELAHPERVFYSTDEEFLKVLRRLLSANPLVGRKALEKLAARYDESESRIIKAMLKVVRSP